MLNIKPGPKVLLVGDFNATCPNWYTTDLYNEAGRILEPSFLSLGLQQCLTVPTHLRSDGDLGSLLDLVLTNDPELCQHSPCRRIIRPPYDNMHSALAKKRAQS